MFDESIQDGEGNELPLRESGNSLVPVAGQAMQQVRTGYTTAIAVQQPRELSVVQKRFLEEARLLGDAAYYGWGAGKDRIEGPSQALAYAVARCWGNCVVDQLPLEETADAWISTSVFVDLETGFTLTRKFRQSKRWTVYGKLDAERKDDMRFQMGQTKGDRNVILKAIPKWLVDQGMDEAKAGVRAKLEKYINKNGLAAAVNYALKELAKSGVKEEQICDKFSVAKTSGLTVDQLVIIAGDIKAIQAGQEYPDSLYPGTEAGDIADQLKQSATPAPAASDAEPPESKPESAPAPDDEDEATEVARCIDELRCVVGLEDLVRMKRRIPESWTVGHRKKVLDAIEMREAEVRGGQAGKPSQKGLLDSGPESATEAGG